MVFNDDSNADEDEMLFVGTFIQNDPEDVEITNKDKLIDDNDAPIEMEGDIPDNALENEDFYKEADDQEDREWKI